MSMSPLGRQVIVDIRIRIDLGVPQGDLELLRNEEEADLAGVSVRVGLSSAGEVDRAGEIIGQDEQSLRIVNRAWADPLC
jgi:hypothetical protein